MVNKERLIQRCDNAFALLAYTFELNEEQFDQIEDQIEMYRDSLIAGNDAAVTLEAYEIYVGKVVKDSPASKYETDQLARDILMVLSNENRWTDVYEHLYSRVS